MSDMVDLRRDRARKVLDTLVSYLEARNDPAISHRIQGKRYEAVLDAVLELTQISG